MKEKNKIYRIPRILYQTWETKTISDDLMKIIESWKDCNPNFEYILFDADERRQFIGSNFDITVLSAFDRIIPGAFKADMFKYCVLYVLGGVFVDINTLCLNKIDDFLDDDVDFVIPIDLNLGITSYNLFNGFMAIKPRHPIMLDCINRVVHNVENNIIPMSNLDFTGPGIIGMSTNLYLENDEHASFTGKEGIINNIKFLNFELGSEYIMDQDSRILFQNKNGNLEIRNIYANECVKNNINSDWGLFTNPYGPSHEN